MKGQSALTIATGAITVTSTKHSIRTQGAVGSDDLDTINGGEEGQLLVINAGSNVETVAVKDGTGNLSLSADFSMTHSEDRLVLIYDNAATLWVELSRSDNNT